MRKLMIAASAAAMLAAASPAAAKTLLIGLDASGSNPLLTNEQHAANVANELGKAVRELDFGDTVVLELFGYHGVLDAPRMEIPISKRYRPKAVARAIAKIVAALPAKAKDGTLQSHGATNILSFLRTRAEQLECRNGDVIWVHTDGIEHSDAVRGDALLSGRAQLPPPGNQHLSGCAVTMTGIGAGRQSLVAKRLKEVWEAYLEAAGANPVSVREG